MNQETALIDIHCHLLPEIDDGAQSWEQSLGMARMAAADGIRTIIVTPHQLGNYAHNYGPLIRARTAELQQLLQAHQVPLRVLPGGDVRIEAGLVQLVQARQVLTLGDQGKHLLLELPHELYFPLDDLLDELQRVGIVGILSHPERNLALLKQPRLIEPLVRRGCLMQVTCGSLLGTFGAACREAAEWLLQQRLVHFLATDAHSPTARRPLMRRAFQRACELVGREEALDLCSRNPAAVVAGGAIQVVAPRPARRSLFSQLFPRRSAA